MRELFLVGTGSFFGGVFRFYLSGWFLHSFVGQRFPLGTFVVNFLGCFIMGVSAGLAEHHHMLQPSSRLFLMTGLLGGFTTFSAFGYETINLLRTQGSLELAAINVVLSVFACLTALWLGLKITGI